MNHLRANFKINTKIRVKNYIDEINGSIGIVVRNDIHDGYVGVNIIYPIHSSYIFLKELFEIKTNQGLWLRVDEMKIIKDDWDI